MPLALITGASSGIGAAVARELDRRGFSLALVARRREKLEEVANRLANAQVYVGDLGVAADAVRVCAEVQESQGVPDVLFLGAGAGRWLSVLETSHEEVVEMMQAPYFAAFHVTRELLGPMLERGTGHILNVTSPAGFIPLPGAAGYASARWAVRGFHESLWAELRGSGVRTTLVCPAEVSSEYFETNVGASERLPKIAAMLFGVMSPEEVARRVANSLGPKPKYLFMPFMQRAIWLLQRFAPGFVNWLVVSTGWKRGG